jgi:hypothetical protein
LNSIEENKELYVDAKRDKEKVEISADGETKKVYIQDMPDRAVMIGSHLSPEEEKELIEFLNKNKDVFAWSAKDLQGVDRDIIEHTLDTDVKITLKVHTKICRKKPIFLTNSPKLQEFSMD